MVHDLLDELVRDHATAVSVSLAFLENYQPLLKRAFLVITQLFAQLRLTLDQWRLWHVAKRPGKQRGCH
jgi:hypothetical protein